MTHLRRRMIEDMQLRGFSARTQECYVAAVRQLAAHFHRGPDQLSEEELRQYFLYLANEKQVARATAPSRRAGSSSSTRRRWGNSGQPSRLFGRRGRRNSPWS